MSSIEHGGPDAMQPVVHDFSTNANPLGPPDEVASAVGRANRRRYPDPDYAALRTALAGWHGVEPQRVLPTAGTSEAIRRLTLAARLHGLTEVWAPRPGYGDYACAARALSLRVREYGSGDELLRGLGAGGSCGAEGTLAWICEPNNPTGAGLPTALWTALTQVAGSRHRTVFALDRAYEPLRLVGSDPVPAEFAQRAWQCLSPNKALGLTGVRAGYLLAPVEDPMGLQDSMGSLAPSWVLSAEGVALLGAWQSPGVQTWLARCRATLALWSHAQRNALHAFGWVQQPSVVPFWLVRPIEQGAALARRLAQLRGEGIKLRETSSLGLPGCLRVSAQAPQVQQALVHAWRRAEAVTP